MISKTFSSNAARRFYDLVGARYDWFTSFDARAKEAAFDQLDLQPGQHVLNVGTGTGKEQLRLQRAISGGGVAFGLDISPQMLATSRKRTGAPLVLADARQLPFAPDSFDRLLSTYVLDLIAAPDLPGMLSSFWRVLKPGGKAVVVTLTEGVSPASRAFVALWKAVYAISPFVCGGCRPLQLREMAEKAGFSSVHSTVVVQMGVPSEVLVMVKDPPRSSV